MTTLKSNLKNISTESEDIIKEYISLLTIKQTEKLALFSGLIASFAILSVLILTLVIFLSIAAAAYLNTLLSSGYLGYIIVSGVYALVSVLLLLKVAFSKTPFLTNIFTKLIISIFNINISYSKNLDGIKREIEHIEYEIEKNKIKIKADAEITKYLILESFVKEFFGLFKSDTKQNEEKTEEKDDSIIKVGK